MNERIRLFWEEAAKKTQGDSWEEQTKFMERYTELIVRECYEHCKDQMMNRKTAEEAGLGYNDGVMDCAIGLIQHFGVEE